MRNARKLARVARLGDKVTDTASVIPAMSCFADDERETAPATAAKKLARVARVGATERETAFVTPNIL